MGGPAPGRIHVPGPIATAADGRIAVADYGVTVLAADGSPLRNGPTHSQTYGVAFGPDGTVYAGEDGRSTTSPPTARSSRRSGTA